MADAANGRVGVLTNTVANLDNYHAVAETSVKFGFNKDNLTPKAQEALDQLAARLPPPRDTSSRWKAERTRLDRLTTTMISASVAPTR